MLKLAKWYCMLLLALPCMAQADTVEITSTSRGTMQPDSAFMALLGMTPPASAGGLPYTLMLSSFVDTEAPGYYEDPLEPEVGADPTRIEVAFTFGDQSFHYAGEGSTFIIAKSYGYNQRVYFYLPQLPGVEFVVGHFVDDPGEAGHPLNPPALDNALPRENPAEAYLYAYLDPNDPNTIVGMDAMASSFSIHAVSPVPEPTSASMLAGGLALLIWRAVRRRGAAWSRPRLSCAR